MTKKPSKTKNHPTGTVVQTPVPEGDQLVLAEDPMTILQLAEYLKVSVGTLRRLVYAKKIPHIRVGNQIRFLAQEVVDSLRK